MILVNKENISQSVIQSFLHRWERTKSDLLALHAMREETVGEDLLEALDIYYDLLKHCHGLQKLDSEMIEQLEALPLNGRERLEFIAKNPRQYASFRQLDELFDETVKKVARIRVQKK